MRLSNTTTEPHYLQLQMRIDRGFLKLRLSTILQCGRRKHDTIRARYKSLTMAFVSSRQATTMAWYSVGAHVGLFRLAASNS